MCYIIRDRRPARYCVGTGGHDGYAGLQGLRLSMEELAVIRVQSRLNIRNAARPDATDFCAVGVVIGIYGKI